MSTGAPKLRIETLDLFERPVVFSKPFRFGSSVVTGAPQAFVRATINVEGHGRAVGGSAEMMVPRWFDKRGWITPAQSVEQLRISLREAAALYSDRASRSAFAHHAQHAATQVAACAARDIPPLAANFGPALIDKAILDALLRSYGLSFANGMSRNIAGLDVSGLADLSQDAVSAFLQDRVVPASIGLRHTVGLDDDLSELADLAARQNLRWFKVKLSGDLARDIDRLARIGAKFDGLDRQVALSVDANEQYAAFADLDALCKALAGQPSLHGIASRLLFIEQPLPREVTFQQPLGKLGERFGFIIDEADDTLDAFPRANALGYRGVSSKSCKGIYKSLFNAARAQAWSRTTGEIYFVSAEDLTCQAGLGVQQDTALAAFIGATHVERNGHHYVDGFAGTSPPESEAFLTAHPDLYERHDSNVRLRTADGVLSLQSLNGPGFASKAMPDWSALTPLAAAQPISLELAS